MAPIARRTIKNLLLVWMLLGSSAWGAEFKAGVARRNITPALPIWLSGYAARTKPADAVLLDLWAKGLAVEDDGGRRAVIVTTDLIGLPHEVSDAVAVRARKQFGLERAQLLMNSSHTHTGPVVWPSIRVMFNFNEDDSRRVEIYARKLTEDLVAVVGEALQDLAPARISVGHGTADFAVNRRQPTAAGVRIGVNPQGPVDHDVPVVKVTGMDGKVRAVLFGYACHNTTLGADYYQVSGDYAGFAQVEVEKRHPDTIAMFMELCGADQNPNPRGTVDQAKSYGKSLSDAVETVLSKDLTTLRPPLRTGYNVVNLKLAPHRRSTFEEETRSPNPFLQRRAKLVLEAYDKGRPERSVPYPIQCLRFNNDLTLLGLGGEVVVDYALRIKREFPRENLVVAGYSNDVMCYIPSQRVLREGGYEPVESMIYYGRAGPFDESVESTVITAVRRLMRKLGVRAE